MRHLLLGPIALALAMPALAQTEPPRAEPAGAAEGAEVILGEVDDAHPEMRLFVTVLRGGEPVLGLGDDDFEVSEDEVRQRPIAVEAQLPPLSVVLAIDTSGSMSERMELTREAAARFAEGLDERDAVQLLRFAREIEAAPMTTTKAKVAEAIAALQARGDTALYDALMRSVELVAAREGRRAIVVLSDGVDDDGTGAPLSEATVDEVLARAGEVNVPIFAIGLGTAMDEVVLERVAEETGGVYLAAPEAGELAAVYDRIGEQLSGQYAVAYRSSLPPDGTARRVDVTALGARGSKSYRPEGMAPAPEPVAGAVEEEPSTGVCAPALAMEAVRAELEQARSRYDQDLINIT